MTTMQNTFKSRFGFHPCDHETYLKLKKLYKSYWKSLYREGDWERWNRKEPQNRIIRKWERNEKGQRVGCKILGPKPEPKKYPLFRFDVWTEFQNARMPKPNAESVIPLGVSIEKIDKVLAEIEAFEANA